VRPPRPLHPLVEWLDRNCHSLRLVFAQESPPRRPPVFSATKESFLPAWSRPGEKTGVVITCLRYHVVLDKYRDAVGADPRGPFGFRSSSRRSAFEIGVRVHFMTLLSAGPCLSISSMRADYFPPGDRAVNLPDFIPSCRSAMVRFIEFERLYIGGRKVRFDLPRRASRRNRTSQAPPQRFRRRWLGEGAAAGGRLGTVFPFGAWFDRSFKSKECANRKQILIYFGHDVPATSRKGIRAIQSAGHIRLISTAPPPAAAIFAVILPSPV